MDQERTPVLDGLSPIAGVGPAFRSSGHKQGRGADPRIAEILFAADVMALSGLDDRLMSQGALEQTKTLRWSTTPRGLIGPRCPSSPATPCRMSLRTLLTR